jgi:hypothetical protein
VTDPVPSAAGFLVTDPTTGERRWISPELFTRMMGELVGRRLPGGCPDCIGTHEYSSDVHGVFDVWVHHEASCPTLLPPGCG